MLPRITSFSSAYLLCESLTIVADSTHRSRIGVINPVLAEAIRDHGSEYEQSPRELVYFRPVGRGGHIPAQMAELDADIDLDAIHVPPSVAESLEQTEDMLIVKPEFAPSIALADPA